MTAGTALAREVLDPADSCTEGATERTDLVSWRQLTCPRRVRLYFDDSITLRLVRDDTKQEILNAARSESTAIVNITSELANQAYIRSWENFRLKFLTALKSEPFEDGVPHPAEDVIRETLIVDDPDNILRFIQEIFYEAAAKQPSAAGTTLRIIGRLPRHFVGDTGILLALSGLQHKELEVRISAVRALESWGGRRARNILITHLEHEPQKWLKKYIKQVIEDLTA